MKAIQIQSYGGPDVLEVREIPEVPILKSGQVLVEVRAAGLNPFDVKLRSGVYAKMMPLTFPCTMGGDFAGVVKALGEDVSTFKIGDEVYGTAIVLSGGSGAYAQVAVANVTNTNLKPKKSTFEEAAALPVAGCSVVQALEEHMHLSKDQKILVHGGAGGIGHMAIQLAKSIGAYAVTTVNADDIEFVKRLGADEIIDYKTQKFEELLKDFDAVYDTVGGETTTKSFQVLRKGGVLVSMLGAPDEALAKKYSVTAIGQNTKNNAEHLKRLAELVDGGKITVHIDTVFPLDQVKEAFIHLETGHPKGKVVVTCSV